MFDPFAAALGADTDAEVVASAHEEARSQDKITGEDLAVLSSGDDGSDHAPVDEAAMQGAAALGADPLVALQASQRQRLPAKTATRNKKRRKMNPRHHLTFTPIQEKNGSSVVCVFVPRTKSSEDAIPLWPQYTATWRNSDFDNTKWLILSNYEKWVMRIVDGVSNKSVRQVAQDMLAAARSEFMACLTKSRILNGQAAHSQDSSDEELSVESPAVPRIRTPVIQVTIGGYDLICLNTQKQIVFKVEQVTTEFIRHWLLPLAMRTAHSQVKPEPPLPKPSAAKLAAEIITGACFHFSANPTPNVAGKLSWIPQAHAWKVKILKPQAELPTEGFKVDPNLESDEYLKEKLQAYQRAASAWNECDGSPRHRIKLPKVLFSELECA